MSAQPNKPTPRKRPLKFANLAPFRKGRPNPERDDRFDRASPVGRHNQAAKDFEAMCLGLNVKKTEYDGDIPVLTQVRQLQTTMFLRRLERVTLHVLDRIGTLALKGAKYLDERKRG